MTERITHLATALSTRPHTEALKQNPSVPPAFRLDFVEVDPIIAAFRRMIRDLEFDVCELAPTTYLVALEAGVPITALPIFLTRRFHHGDLVCRRGSGIETPKDLEGRRVGVRAYTVSTGVWLRGILASEYDVDLDSITWVVDDEEHVTSTALPANVEKTSAGDSIADQFAAGTIDAALTGPAGIGRKGAPTDGWSESGVGFDEGREATESFYPMFADADRLEADWYRRTSIYPIHGLVALKTSVVDDHPELSTALWNAFTEAKAPFIADLSAGSGTGKEYSQYRAFRQIVGDDPLPYGVDQNRATLDALCDFAVEQHILTHRPAIEDIFAKF